MTQPESVMSDVSDADFHISECLLSLKGELGNYVTNDTNDTAPAAVALLATLRERELTLQADGDRLRWSGPRGALTDELRQALADHKPAIIALLHAEASTSTAGDRLDLAALVRPLATYPCSTCGAELVMGAGDYGRLACYGCLQQYGSLGAALASLDASPVPPANVLQFGQALARRKVR